MTREGLIKNIALLLTLITGFILALLADTVHSMFFCLPVIGAIAPLARGRKRSPAAITALAILVIAVCGYGYTSMPRYRYGYQVSLLRCQENIDLYLPLGDADET